MRPRRAPRHQLGKDERSAFVLKENKGVTTEICAGLLPSVQYVEHCL